MIFKTRRKTQKFNWTDKTWINDEYQCPVCKQWFRCKRGNVEHHITLLAKEEAFKKSLGMKNSCKHLTILKRNVHILKDKMKIIWK